LVALTFLDYLLCLFGSIDFFGLFAMPL
jgi:hypothetical protein